jgi:hypothetical protein
MLSYEEIEASVARATQGATFGYEKVKEYLRERGIDDEVISQSGIAIYPAAQIFKRIYGNASDDRLAIVFPHYDLGGEPIDWWSARLIETNSRGQTGFLRDIERPARGKMTCPPNEMVHGYYPQNIDWSQLKKGDTIYVHESCIKALNGARLGTYSVGLNGVWGYLSRKHNVELIPELLNLPWRELSLNCKIVFDSNYATNPDVGRAIASLAERLDRHCGVRATHLPLPKGPDNRDWGFDDFVAYHGLDDAKAFLDQSGESIEVGVLARHKNELNTKVCVVRSLGAVAEIATGTIMSHAKFINVNYADYQAPVESGNGVVMKSSAKMWLMDKNRTSVEKLDYIPGEEKIVNDTLNTWNSSGLEPVDDDIEWWWNVLYNNMEPETAKYMMDWLAYPLQYPGKKLTTYLYIHGPSGVGKNRLMLPLEKIYGSNFAVVTKQDIESDFNTLLVNKQLINADELSGGRDNQDKIAQKIKRFVTGETINVNTKGIPQYPVRNCANLIVTSNYPDAIRLDDDDRRAYVIKFENKDDHRRDRVYWDEYTHEVENGGAAALLYKLLHRDLSQFDPNAPAPMSKEKMDSITATRSEIETWCRDLADDPSQILPMNVDSKCVFTTSELAVLYYGKAADDLPRGAVDRLGIYLGRAGLNKANDGKTIKANGRSDRYWIVKKKHLAWTNAEVQANVGGTKVK